MKKKYKVMKKDEQAYDDMSNAFDREKMSDYSFKKRTQVEGKNITRLRRNKIIKIVLLVLGAFIIMSIGYFIVATVRNVNSYRPVTTTASTTAEVTTVASGETTQASSSTTAENDMTSKIDESTSADNNSTSSTTEKQTTASANNN